MTPVGSIKVVKNRGLVGDRYYHGSGFWQNLAKPRITIRDVSIIRAKDIVDSGFSEAETRRNIVVSTEASLLSLIGKTFLIGEVAFEGHEECTPCKRPSELSGKENFAKIFKNTGGIRAKVLTDGEICIGDSLCQP